MSKATETLILKTTGSMITKLSIETQWSKHMLGLLRNAFASGEENPEILGWMFTEIPEEISGRNGYMSRAEKAIYLALCIYASVGKKSTLRGIVSTGLKSGVRTFSPRNWAMIPFIMVKYFSCSSRNR